MYVKDAGSAITFIKTDTSIVNVAHIASIDIRGIDDELIAVYDMTGTMFTVSGFGALELVWMLKPSALEGHPRIKWARHKWAVHNMIGHPLMQLLAWCGLPKLAIRVHDLTVPKPRSTVAGE